MSRDTWSKRKTGSFFRSCGEENKIMCRELSKSHSTHRNFSSSPLSLQPEIKAVTERPRVKHLCNLQKRESRSDRSYLQLWLLIRGTWVCGGFSPPAAAVAETDGCPLWPKGLPICQSASATFLRQSHASLPSKLRARACVFGAALFLLLPYLLAPATTNHSWPAERQRKSGILWMTSAVTLNETGVVSGPASLQKSVIKHSHAAQGPFNRGVSLSVTCHTLSLS